MPMLVRVYIINVAIGFALAVLFTGLLIAFDVAHLRHLIASSPLGWLAVLMLVMFNGIVFSGVQFGIVIMSMAETDGTPRRGLRIPALSAFMRRDMSPVPVRQARGDD